MYFLIEENDLLEKCKTIWDKFSADIKKEYYSEPVQNRKILKTKIKSYDDEVPDFYNKQIPKMDSNHTCLTVISVDSAFKKGVNYYLQVFLKKCKCIEKKMIRYIVGLESSSDDSDEQIKATRLVFSEKEILKISYLRQ